MDYKKAIDVLEELLKLNPENEEELALVIKTMKNIEKALGYSNIKD